MPNLTIPNTFVPFTKILSAQMNANFTAIATLLNTTKLDSTNIQDLGITLSKLAQSSAVAGQFAAWNGSAWVPAGNPVSSQYNVIFGSAAQVTAGTATHSTVASWAQADGDRVLILPQYSESANWTVTKKVQIYGLGNTSQITGSLTFATGSTASAAQNCRITTGVTIDSGITSVIVDNVWFPSGQTFTDNSTVALSNYLIAMQES